MRGKNRAGEGQEEGQVLETANAFGRLGVREEKEMGDKAKVGLEWRWVALSAKLKSVSVC